MQENRISIQITPAEVQSVKDALAKQKPTTHSIKFLNNK